LNPRIEKLKAERDSIAEKVEKLTARLKALDEQIIKLENTDIVGIVRENGLSIDQLAALMALLDKEPHGCGSDHIQTKWRKKKTMKNKTRLCAMMLAVLCCVMALSVSAFAASLDSEGYYASNENGEETPPDAIDQISISTENVPTPTGNGGEPGISWDVDAVELEMPTDFLSGIPFHVRRHSAYPNRQYDAGRRYSSGRKLRMCRTKRS
jgi:hypothetical protein